MTGGDFSFSCSVVDVAGDLDFLSGADLVLVAGHNNFHSSVIHAAAAALRVGGLVFLNHSGEFA